MSGEARIQITPAAPGPESVLFFHSDDTRFLSISNYFRRAALTDGFLSLVLQLWTGRARPVGHENLSPRKMKEGRNVTLRGGGKERVCVSEPRPPLPHPSLSLSSPLHVVQSGQQVHTTSEQSTSSENASKLNWHMSLGNVPVS